ncbi:MAG: hypothetical protein GQ559_10970 [Desulfobulbaceae bacterium]|nr:hypothetical protein [Desulfobulbaceae bacterium]
MSIRNKILGAICGITLCLILIFYAATSFVIQKNFDQLERDMVVDSLERVHATLRDQIQALDTLAHDWASWDDTYIFVNDRNEDFIASNIVEGTFTSSANIDLLLIFNTDEDLVHGVLFNKQEHQMETPDSTLLSSLTEHDQLLNHTSPYVGKSGIVQLGDRYLVIAARPILTSNGVGPDRGILMMGRLLNMERIAALQRITRTSTNLYPVRQAIIPPDATSASQALLLSHTPHHVTVFSEKIIKGYTLLNDVSDNAVLLLAINVDRDIHQQIHKTLLFLLYSIISIGIVFGFVVFHLIDFLVLGRLLALTDDVVQIEKNTTHGSRVRESSPRDELGKLSKSINQMMDAIESFEKYKIKSEKLEALATFAAGATHEFATPLSTIAIASGEILHDLKENNTTEEELYEDILLIREQVNKCKDILYQMAADAGEHMGEEVVSISTEKLIDDALVLFDKTTSKQVEVDNQVAGRVITMPVRSLRRVLRGILKNSMDASEPGTPIFLSCRENDTHLLFEVRDQGEGMDEHTLKHATDPFFTTKSPGNGMGLGLYLAQSLANRFGGNLLVSSSPAAGTTVTLSFAKETIYV